MFFRENRSKNAKLPVLQLVENVRTTRGPRVRIVVSLGTGFKIPKSDVNYQIWITFCRCQNNEAVQFALERKCNWDHTEQDAESAAITVITWCRVDHHR